MLKIAFGYIIIVMSIFLTLRLACDTTIQEENKFTLREEKELKSDLRVFTNQFYIDTINDVIIKYANEDSNGAIVIPPAQARILRQRINQLYEQLSSDEKNNLEDNVVKIIFLIK